MNKAATIIQLASASPRRRQLLEQLGWQVQVHPVDIDETPATHEDAAVYCLRMAEQKVRTAMTQLDQGLPIIASDTTVVLDQHILGKPHDNQEAGDMLQRLSGRTHQVMTAVALAWQGKVETQISINTVRFAVLEPQLIDAYVATGEPLDKAGSYGIQGMAARWIEHIEGSYSAIMGLPLFETSQLLNKRDIISPLDVS
ncbi:Maf family protein [Marinicella sediminis]|uniref:dTTP/UTP pyrophosphatase n=1 Tax=Marinicella sediminis TaxID=1792834 RepID=A0ABV7JAD5_9GAMM|nr:Maf family protein [Marinicella sediminis]